MNHLFEFDVERPPNFTLKPPRKPSSWLLPRCIMRWPTLTTRSCHSAEAKAREVEGPGCPFPQSSSCNSGYNYRKHGFVQAPFDAMKSVRSLQLTDGWPDLWQKTVFALYGNDVNPRLRIERSISGAGGCLVFVCLFLLNRGSPKRAAVFLLVSLYNHQKRGALEKDTPVGRCFYSCIGVIHLTIALGYFIRVR